MDGGGSVHVGKGFNLDDPRDRCCTAICGASKCASLSSLSSDHVLRLNFFSKPDSDHSPRQLGPRGHTLQPAPSSHHPLQWQSAIGHWGRWRCYLTFLPVWQQSKNDKIQHFPLDVNHMRQINKCFHGVKRFFKVNFITVSISEALIVLDTYRQHGQPPEPSSPEQSQSVSQMVTPSSPQCEPRSTPPWAPHALSCKVENTGLVAS